MGAADSPSRRAHLDDRHEAAVARLQDSGWRVAVVEAGGSVVLAWEGLERTGVRA